MIKTAVLTISDKGSNGLRDDLTGYNIKKALDKSIYEVIYYKIIPDDLDCIYNELIELSDNTDVNLILTNGGTGFSKRDVTPEATRKAIEKEVPGIPEAMRQSSCLITKKAILSRAVAGIRKNSLIINLPGSPNGAVENLYSVLPVLPHGIEILKGEASECALDDKIKDC